MPKFLYTAWDKRGNKITDIEEAETKDALIKYLQAKDLVVTSIEPRPEEEIVFPRKLHRFTHNRIKLDDLVFFARQLATLLDAGVTLLKSLDVISQQIESKNFFSVVERVKKDIEGGFAFRDALAKHKKVFSDLWVNLAETGEASGNLAIVLDRLAKFLEARAAFKREIISAMIYPTILLFVAIGAITFFILKIIPTFMKLFEGLGIKLPLLTQWVINLSKLVQIGFIPSILILVFLLFIFQRFIKTEKGRRIFDDFKLKIPLLGRFFRNILFERFSSEMSTLIESGVPLLFALEVTERAIGNKVVGEMVKKIKEDVRIGKTLSKPLSELEFFPPLLVQMVAIGEETGNLSGMFKKLASYYEEYIVTLTKRLTSMFEPLIIVLMAGFIGVLVISMFLPIFQLATVGIK
jgi:type IV pilus assembly protein PilC